MSDLRYPIGPFEADPVLTPEKCRERISNLKRAPGLIRAAVAGLSPDQLDTPYRPDGWTVRQVVNHVADSQLHWYIRLRFALTEEAPVIKPFPENVWAELQDARLGPIEPSLSMLDGLYTRSALLFECLEQADWSRTIFHPERGTVTVELISQLFVWHGRHHTAHIMELRKRMGW